LKIAIHNPQFIFQDQTKNFNGYNFEFLKNHTDIIYLSKPWHVFRYKKRLKELEVDASKFDFVFSIDTLNKKADVLLSFNGVPYVKHFTPPKKFKGLKIWHTMDYVFKASESNRILVENGVDYVMGYTRHDLYCPFFQKYYAEFKDKVIPVPFGYGERFDSNKVIDERIKKILGIGSINPIIDPLVKESILKEYIDFFKMEWGHPIRAIFRKNERELSDIFDSFFPSFDKTKNPNYNPVELLNKYTFFINDATVMNFPPARTYEGIACGSIMIADNHDCYKSLGFRDNYNCILFNYDDDGRYIKELHNRIINLINDEKKVSVLSQNAKQLARQFSHKSVATELYIKIKDLKNEKK